MIRPKAHSVVKRKKDAALWHTSKGSVPQLYCCAVIFGIRQVIFAYGSFGDEYNITKADRLLYHFPKGKYHSERTLGISLPIHRFNEHRILTPKSVIHLLRAVQKRRQSKFLLCLLPYEASRFR